jgi:hypothetical protein
MKSDQVLGLVHGSRSDTSELLHVGTNTQQQAHMNAKGSDIGSSFTTDPEDTEMTIIVELDNFALVNGSNTELSLDG